MYTKSNLKSDISTYLLIIEHSNKAYNNKLELAIIKEDLYG